MIKNLKPQVNKMLSLLLAFCMVLSVAPVTAFAVSINDLDHDLPHDFSFERITVGDPTPEAKTVTLTNNTGQELTNVTLKLGSVHSGHSEHHYRLNGGTDNVVIPSIAIGGTATFTMQPNDNLPLGSYLGSVVVTTDQTGAGLQIISFNYFFVDDVSYTATISPNRIKFADLQEGATPSSMTATITNTNASHTLTGLTIAPQAGETEHFSVSIDKTTLAPNEKATITVTPKSDLAASHLNYQTAYSVSHEVSGSSLGLASFSAVIIITDPTYSVSALPANIDLGSIAEGETLPSGNTQITNNGGGNLTGLSATSPNYNISFSPTSIGIGESSTMTVTPKDSVTTVGDHSTTLSIFATEAGSSVGSVPVTFEITAGTYSVSMNPSSLNFNSIAEGETLPTEKTVTITNNGTSNLTNLSVSSSKYDITFDDTNLAKNAHTTMRVTPKNTLTEGNHDETLYIRADETGSSVGSVPVTFEITAETHTLTVVNGTGSGNFVTGYGATITANAPETGRFFDKWTVTSGSATINDINSATTTVVIGSGDATVTASYKDTPQKQFSPELDEVAFADLVVDYSSARSMRFGVQNTGSETITTGEASATLTGANSTSFTLNASEISGGILAGDWKYITITPNTGLSVGNYVANIQITGTGIETVNIPVSLEVVDATTYELQVTPNSHTFANTTVGYSPVTADIFTIRSVGSGAVWNLDVTLSDTSKFTLDTDGMWGGFSAAQSGLSTTFKLNPNHGLGVGTHTVNILIDAREETAFTGTPITQIVIPVSFTVLSDGSATVSSVDVTPTSAIIEKGNTQDFNANVIGTGSPAQTVDWTVEGATASTIDTNGLLTVGASETATSITVRATSKVDASKSGTAVVTVTTPAPTALTGTATITGTAKYGETLTADTSGISNNTGTFSYQWKRGTTNIGTNSSTYTLEEADIGETITVEITSSVQTGTITSSATATVEKADGAAAPTAPTESSKTHNSITVNTVVGQEYRLDTTGAWQPTGTFSSLSANTSYNIYTRIKETDTTEASAISEALNVTTDTAPLDALLGTATITGTAKYGEILTADTSGITNNTGTFSYQWKRGTTNIGTNSSTYTLEEADIGETITVEITSSVQTGTITSSATATVEKADGPAAPTAPVLNGVATSDIIQVIPQGGQEYSRDGINWQLGGNFTGLIPNTTYNIITRVAETATHKASVNSPALSVTTNAAPVTNHTITYDANGGTGTQANGSATNGVAFTFPTTTTFNAPAGKQFKGWALTNTATTVITSSTFTADDTVYAIWEFAPLTGTATIDDTTPAIGETLTASLTGTNNTGTLSYQWKRGSTNVGSNSNTYEVVAADVGSKITVTITSSAQTGAITSAETAPATDPSKTNQTLSFAPTGITATVGDTTVTEPTLSGDMTTVSYTSGNTKVATVNPTSGEVTIVGAGTAVITANAMADATYNAGTASYTLTVNAGTITAGSDETTVFEGEFAQLESVKITVGGTTTTLTQVGNKLTGYTGYTFNGGVVGEVNPGSIAVTLYKEFLATLPAGGYTLAITLTGGVSAGTVTATIPAKTQHDVEITEVGVGGTATVNNQDLGTIVSLNAGTKDGYTFSSWTTTGSITIDSYSSANTSFVVLGDATIKANWTKNSSPTTGGTSSSKYNLVVNYGSGDGNYESGTWITIKAENRSGYTFSHWTSEEVTFENAKAETTRFIMNSKNVEVTAVYVLNDDTTLTPEKEDVKPEETTKPDDSKEEADPVETEKPVETEPPVVGGDSENEPTSADGGSSMLPILGIGAVVAAIAAFLVSKKRKSE